jgi:hypothetical protein
MLRAARLVNQEADLIVLAIPEAPHATMIAMLMPQLRINGTRPVKTVETVVDSTTSIVIGGDYAAAFCGCAGFQFQGRSWSIRLAGWSCSRARTSASQACGSMSLSLAVSMSV